MSSNEINPVPKRALVTGASAGIGAAFAQRLARNGYDLILVARRQARLEQLAQQLQSQYGVTSEVIVADLAEPDGLRTVVQRIEQELDLDMLVNNAGFIDFSPVAEHDSLLMKRMIDLHLTATVRLTRAVLPGMIERQQGTIINVASITALFTEPDYLATYSATKSFLVTFTRGLFEEVREAGIRVQALCPGYTHSELFEAAAVDWGMPEGKTMTAEDLVAASLAGLQMGEVICMPALEDDSLLTKLTEIQDAIATRVMSTGIPAHRYEGSSLSSQPI